jgi:hypothetical protein
VNAVEALRAWVPADVLVSRLERELRAQGATFDDLDERMAAELGVAVEAWFGYLTVKRAADRYQGAALQKHCDESERE